PPPCADLFSLPDALPIFVVACSALKRAYRDQIRVHAPEACFALLNVHREKLVDRIAHRADHFMPGSLLESQLATLEPLGGDEGRSEEHTSELQSRENLVC